tara:strand:+ start:320 stop:784 length:465 start_codon:yes stop_codon:yes gene_type:complete
MVSSTENADVQVDLMNYTLSDNANNYTSHASDKLDHVLTKLSTVVELSPVPVEDAATGANGTLASLVLHSTNLNVSFIKGAIVNLVGTASTTRNQSIAAPFSDLRLHLLCSATFTDTASFSKGAHDMNTSNGVSTIKLPSSIVSGVSTESEERQ